MTNKQAAKDWIAKGGLSIYSDAVRVAAMRLLEDLRADEAWQAGLTVGAYEDAVHTFAIATERSAWRMKSDREQREWADQFSATLDKLFRLMDEAPVTPKEWGFPARDHVLANVFYRAGVKFPDPKNINEFYGKVLELEAAADAEDWTIVDSLKHYQSVVEYEYEDPQTLKKPKDPKASRAEFIQKFTQYQQYSANVVACIAMTLFDDESIDDRLIRKHAYRADSSKI